MQVSRISQGHPSNLERQRVMESEGDQQDRLMDCCIINRFHSREKGEGKVGEGEGMVEWCGQCLTGGEERFHSREKGEGKWVGEGR
jgi:hypothetical protein